MGKITHDSGSLLWARLAYETPQQGDLSVMSIVFLIISLLVLNHSRKEVVTATLHGLMSLPSVPATCPLSYSRCVYQINITSAISLMRWHITMCNSNKLHLESHIKWRHSHPWHSNDVGWFLINKIDKQTTCSIGHTGLGFYIFSRGLLEWHLVSTYYLLQHMEHEASAASIYMYSTAIKKEEDTIHNVVPQVSVCSGFDHRRR